MTAGLLGALSLLVAAITALYSIWLPEVNAVLDSQVPSARGKQRQDLVLKHRKVNKARVLPLLIFSILLVLALLPSLVEIVLDAVGSFSSEAIWNYDPAKMIFVVVYAVCTFLSWTLFTLCRKIIKSAKDIDFHNSQD